MVMQFRNALDNPRTETLVGTGAVATLLAVQFLTSADPIGKSTRFFLQLRGQVRCGTRDNESGFRFSRVSDSGVYSLS